MNNGFECGGDFIGKFAVVKLWPELKTAEDECIARIKLAAHTLGLECIEIGYDGALISNPDLKISKKNVDFVIHLHYDTPKCYDAFSFAALWNPIQFYHEWGYSRCTRNLTTHDDFFSCGSDVADAQVKRAIRDSFSHLPPAFNFYHSMPDVVREPTLGDMKLFYAGINWEAVSGGKSRHQEVLKMLDKTDDLRIYGPRRFQGINVWAGYKSYVTEIPFDGISMMQEISKAGIALVLSSKAHKESGLMSSRLFESIAAGAVIICDENPFARKHFGDAILYIDTRATINQLFDDIQKHLAWIKNNKNLAIEKAKKAQLIFKQGFTLVKSLRDLYASLPSRKATLHKRQTPETVERFVVDLFFMLPVFDLKKLQTHLKSIDNQDYQNISANLIIGSEISVDDKRLIDQNVAGATRNINIITIDTVEYALYPELASNRKTGAVISDILHHVDRSDAFIIVAPNEELLSNHVSVLAGSLIRNLSADCSATAVIHKSREEIIHGVHDAIDFGRSDKNRGAPNGYGRFIFRQHCIREDIDIAVPYLEGSPLAVLVGEKPIVQELPATVIIDVDNVFPVAEWRSREENEVIWAYCKNGLTTYEGRFFTPQSDGLSIPRSRRQIILGMFSPRWIRAQIVAVRKHGLAARMKVLRKKLSA